MLAKKEYIVSCIRKYLLLDVIASSPAAVKQLTPKHLTTLNVYRSANLYKPTPSPFSGTSPHEGSGECCYGRSCSSFRACAYKHKPSFVNFPG